MEKTYTRCGMFGWGIAEVSKIKEIKDTKR